MFFILNIVSKVAFFLATNDIYFQIHNNYFAKFNNVSYTRIIQSFSCFHFNPKLFLNSTSLKM